jgi:hypothetical protein
MEAKEIENEIRDVYSVHGLKSALRKAVEYLVYLNVAPTGAAEEGLIEVLKILKKSQ